jgi:hypothetical protein
VLDARKGSGEHGPTAPKSGPIDQLPEPLDLKGVFAIQAVFHILQGADQRVLFPGAGGFANSNNPSSVCNLT